MVPKGGAKVHAPADAICDGMLATVPDSEWEEMPLFGLMVPKGGANVHAPAIDAIRDGMLATVHGSEWEKIAMKRCLYLDLSVAALTLHQSCVTSDLKAVLGIIPVPVPFMARPTSNLSEVAKQLVHMALKAGSVPPLLTKFAKHGLLNPLTVGAQYPAPTCCSIPLCMLHHGLRSPLTVGAYSGSAASTATSMHVLGRYVCS